MAVPIHCARRFDTALIKAVAGLLAGVKEAPADKSGNDAGFDGHNPAGRAAGEDEVIRQTVQGVKGSRRAIGASGEVDTAGFLIQETGREAITLVFLTDATGAGKQPIVDC